MNTETNLVAKWQKIDEEQRISEKSFYFLKITFRISMMMPKTFGWTKAVVRSVASS